MESSPQAREQRTWQVVRVSVSTGRTLKIIEGGFSSQRHAQLFAAGFGRDTSHRTIIRTREETS